MAEHDLAKVDTRVQFSSQARCFAAGPSLVPTGTGGKSGLHHLTLWKPRGVRTRKHSLRIDILSALKGGDSYHRRKPAVSVGSCFTGNRFGKPKSYVASTGVYRLGMPYRVHDVHRCVEVTVKVCPTP